MKIIKYILLLGCIVLSGCARETSTRSESKIEEIGYTEPTATRIVHENLAFSITDMFVMDSMVVCKTEKESPVYICYDVLDGKKVKNLGTIGRAQNEWIKPQMVARSDNGYDIFDNGKAMILSYNNDTLISRKKYQEMIAVNRPRIINEKYSGYSYIQPNKTALVIYNANSYERVDEYAFEDEQQGGNSINWDFSWSGERKNIVIAHLYKKEFYILELNDNGRFSQCKKFVGEYTFNRKEHAYYSDAIISEGLIYLLNQQHVNLVKEDGNSEIDIFDTAGKHIKKLQLDVVARYMCVVGDVIWLLDIGNNLRVCKNTII